MSEQEEEKKPADLDVHINLKVKGQTQSTKQLSSMCSKGSHSIGESDENEVFFRIKRSTQLQKLMNAYCDRQSVNIKSIAFLFDSHKLTRGANSI